MLVLRSRTGPAPGNRAAWPVLLAAAAIFAVGLGLPLSPLAPAVGMHAPPLAFFPLLAAVAGGYGAIIGRQGGLPQSQPVPALSRLRRAARRIHLRFAELRKSGTCNVRAMAVIRGGSLCCDRGVL